ncbi:MAG: glycoside hydrolase family 10 protein [Fimbriimonadaceae bacterium]
MIGVLMAAMFGHSAEVPEFPREFRGAWVATVANIDWPTKPGLSTQAQQQELIGIFEMAKSLNLNGIILQVRPMSDSLYESPHEPWSYYLTGESGKAPNPPYDPLEFAIREAHARGIELHAWFNPYRVWRSAINRPPHRTHSAQSRKNLVRTYGEHLWFDPGEPEVAAHSLQVMLDVVKRYDIDGIHIDDYFYPYPITENGKKVDFPDEASYRRYRTGGGTLSRNDWRRKNVDDFVEKLYKETKALKPHVRVGISPFGIYRPGVPAGIRAGIDQYDELYADVLKWYHQGWFDYMAPQLYWPTTQTAQAYPVLLKWWADENRRNRHLWIGNYTSQLNTSNAAWTTQELVKQIELTRENAVASGNIHFSFKAFPLSYKGIDKVLSDGPYQDAALPPVMDWIPGPTPKAPVAVMRMGTKVAIQAAEDALPVVQWAISYRDRDRIRHRLVPGSVTEWTAPASAQEIWVRAVNRASRASEAVVATPGATKSPSAPQG